MPVTSPVNQAFTFHCGLPEIDALYGQGKVAVVLNMGSLRQPWLKRSTARELVCLLNCFRIPIQTLQNQSRNASRGSDAGWGAGVWSLLGTGGHLDSVALNSGGFVHRRSDSPGNLIPSDGSLYLSGLNGSHKARATRAKAATTNAERQQ